MMKPRDPVPSFVFVVALASLVIALLTSCAAPGSPVRLTLKPSTEPLTDNAFQILKLVEGKRATDAGFVVKGVYLESDGGVVLEVVRPTDYDDIRAAALFATRGRVEFIDWASLPASVSADWDVYLSSAAAASPSERPKPLEEGVYESVLGDRFAWDAKVSKGQGNSVEILVDMDDDSTAAWGEFTKSHVNGRVAIVLDGNVLMAPVIVEPILDGNVSISGGLTEEEARDLAIILESGPLPQRMSVVE